MRLTELDFIKGIAILCVLLLHLVTFKGGSGVAALFDSMAVYHVWQAVPLFLLLFGFTLAHSISKGSSAASIASSRLRRFLPALLVTYAVSFLLWWSMPHQQLPVVETMLGRLPTPGPGGYFVTLYLGAILIVPFLVIAYRRFGFGGVWALSLGITLVGEAAAFHTQPDGYPFHFYFYSGSVHRYALLIPLGMHMRARVADGAPLITPLIAFCGAISAWLLWRYLETHKPIPPFDWGAGAKWGFQHAPYFFYTYVLAAALYWAHRHLRASPARSVIGAIERIGQASLHIFLGQVLLFFWLVRAGLSLDWRVYLSVAGIIVLGVGWQAAEVALLRRISGLSLRPA